MRIIFGLEVLASFSIAKWINVTFDEYDIPDESGQLRKFQEEAGIKLNDRGQSRVNCFGSIEDQIDNLGLVKEDFSPRWTCKNSAQYHTCGYKNSEECVKVGYRKLDAITAAANKYKLNELYDWLDSKLDSQEQLNTKNYVKNNWNVYGKLFEGKNLGFDLTMDVVVDLPTISSVGLSVEKSTSINEYMKMKEMEMLTSEQYDEITEGSTDDYRYYDNEKTTATEMEWMLTSEQKGEKIIGEIHYRGDYYHDNEYGFESEFLGLAFFVCLVIATVLIGRCLGYKKLSEFTPASLKTVQNKPKPTIVITDKQMLLPDDSFASEKVPEFFV